jgi:hypothetical protein
VYQKPDKSFVCKVRNVGGTALFVTSGTGADNIEHTQQAMD